MSNTELESLARHLGHDMQTHKENYRLSHATRELTVVSTNNLKALVQLLKKCYTQAMFRPNWSFIWGIISLIVMQVSGQTIMLSSLA